MKKTNKFQKTSSNWTLIGLCIGSALVVLDANVLNVALPEIKTAFSALATDFLWILNAYTLVFAVGLLPAGIFASRFGGEFTFLLGLVIFGFSSLACALTMTAKFLIFMRIFQGIGASLLAVTGLSLISSQYPDSKQRGYALSI